MRPFFVDETSLCTTVVLWMRLQSWQTENNNVQQLLGCWFWFFIHVKVVVVHCPEKASTSRQMQINVERIQTVEIKDRAGAVWAQSFPDGRKINRFLQHIQMISTFYTGRVLCWKIQVLPTGENDLLHQNVTNPVITYRIHQWSWVILGRNLFLKSHKDGD